MHTTVLLKEAVDALDIQHGDTVIDCTYGAGGHSNEILTRLNGSGELVSIDADETAFLGKEPAVNQRFVVSNFRAVGEVVREASLPAPSAILADLGWRSEQFAEGGKGFSFKYDEPLIMTFGQPETSLFTAYDVVNDWDEENLADIIYGYGEERAARKIAHAIVKARQIEPIATSVQLATIIDEEVGRFYKHTKIHPATKTFQAIRMAVNDELGALKALLTEGFELLAPKGHLAIISFHSLEDRIIKHTFKSFVNDERGILLSKKPLTPGTEELSINPRARSAKLRVLIKT